MLVRGARGRLRASTAAETGAMFVMVFSEFQGWSVAVSWDGLIRGGIGPFCGLWGFARL